MRRALFSACLVLSLLAVACTSEARDRPTDAELRSALLTADDVPNASAALYPEGLQLQLASGERPVKFDVAFIPAKTEDGPVCVQSLLLVLDDADAADATMRARATPPPEQMEAYLAAREAQIAYVEDLPPPLIGDRAVFGHVEFRLSADPCSAAQGQSAGEGSPAVPGRQFSIAWRQGNILGQVTTLARPPAGDDELAIRLARVQAQRLRDILR